MTRNAKRVFDMTHEMNRRGFLAASAAAVAGSAFAPSLAAAATKAKYPRGKAEQCIMIWLGGGMGQIDTFDPKGLGDPRKKVAGSYYPSIKTAVKGVEVCEHLRRTADVMDRFALMRTVWHDVVDEHGAATNRMHTGRPTAGTIVYPSLGSIVAHEKEPRGSGIPPYVLIGYPNVSRGPGFLPAQYDYLYLTDTSAGPAGLTRPADITPDRQQRRDHLLNELRAGYVAEHGDEKLIKAYDTTIGRAADLAGPKFMSVFNLDEEPRTLRESYGGEFGQRCLLARRLCQSGVRFVEVSHNLNFINGTGWDVHKTGILQQHGLIQEMDQALAVLVLDLEKQNMLDQTLIVVSSEFGRPAGFDAEGGRGHHSKAFTVVLAGGGLRLGRAVGETDEKAEKILHTPVSVPDLFATICCTLGIDPSKNLYAGDRPVPITDMGKPAAELFG